jgi:outer membrane protein assembly factor BamB/hemolysin-activating ACP:hemolysin acyltransferase/orotate phosphoribosyltransferase
MSTEGVIADPGEQPGFAADSAGRPTSDARVVRLHHAILNKSLVSGGQRRIVSPTGREQSWLIDLRPILLDPETLSDICSLFWDAVEKSGPFQICGLETASIPLLTGLTLEGYRRGRRLNAFIVRKERKTSGLARNIEGDINDMPIVVIDDLTNSSSSLEKVRVTLADYGRAIDHIFVVIDFKARKSLEWRKRQGLRITSLFAGSDFPLKRPDSAVARPAHRFSPVWSSAASDADHFDIAPRSSPVVCGDRIFVGTEGGRLRALESATGAELWSFQAEGCWRKGIWSTPAVFGGCIFFGAYNGSLYCLDIVEGHQRWRADCADWIGSSPIISTTYGLVVIGLEHALAGRRGSVAAFRLDTGEKVWERDAAELVHGSAALSEDQSRLFIGTNGGELLCLDTLTGALRWRFRAGGELKAAPAVAHDAGVVIVGSFDGCLYLVDGSTGEPKAVVKTNSTIYTTPLVIGDLAFAGSNDKHLYIVDTLDGSVVEKLDLGARIFATPVLIDGIVYVGTTAGKLVGIDPASLAISEELQLPDRIVNPPVEVQGAGLLVVPMLGNRLIAYRMERLGASPSSARRERPPTAPAASPLAPAVVAAARPEGLYYRIDEPPGRQVSQPFSSIPSRRLLGAVALLLMKAPQYRDLSQRSIEARVLPALVANQVRVFLFGYQPVGVVTWALLSAEVEQQLLDGRLPDTGEWSSGDRAWIVDVVAPFGGGEAMLDRAMTDNLRGKVVRMLRPAPTGRFEAVTLTPRQ